METEKLNNVDNTVILDVTLIEPRLKHSTIFELYENLDEGMSFIIKNDHDPKPLHYQFMAEKGDAFAWEYLENGPVEWMVKITKKKILKDPKVPNLKESEGKTIGEIVAENPEKINVFKKYKIDFCCGGDKTLGEACKLSGIDESLVMEELEGAKSANNIGADADKSKIAALNQRFNEWDANFLIDYIVNNHHAFLRKYLPEANDYIEKIASVHGEHHPEIIQIKSLFIKLVPVLTLHIDKEEEQLFPAIKFLTVAGKNAGQKGGKPSNEFVASELSSAKDEHEYVGQILKEMDYLSSGYITPPDACASYRHTYKLLRDISDDIMIHVHLENNILFKEVAAE